MNGLPNEYDLEAIELKKAMSTISPHTEGAMEGVLDGAEWVKAIHTVGELVGAGVSGEGRAAGFAGVAMEEALSLDHKAAREYLGRLKSKLMDAAGYALWWKVRYLSCDCNAGSYKFTMHHKVVRVVRLQDNKAVFGGAEEPPTVDDIDFGKDKAETQGFKGEQILID